MVLSVIGINHQNTAIALRERLAYDKQQVSKLLKDIKKQSVSEAVLLSTCNRTELYFPHDDADALLNWWLEQHPVLGTQFTQYCYQHHGDVALQHLLRVAIGLDSMLIGEPQIFGQIKHAYQVANDIGVVGPTLQSIFPAVFAAAKTVRQQSAVGEHCVSLAYLIVYLAKRIFSSLKDCKVLLVGGGETIELVATHLYSSNIQQLTVANRRIEKVIPLRERFNATLAPINQLPELVAQADIVISATASQVPIIGKGTLEAAIKQRKHKPMLVADLAMPRDVEPQANTLDDVFLYDLDDLHTLLKKNATLKNAAAARAEQLTKAQVAHCLATLKVKDAGNIIRDFRAQAERLRDQALQKAQQAIANGEDANAVLANLAHTLTNKILHQPTVRLRNAAYQNDMELLQLAKRLFE